MCLVVTVLSSVALGLRGDSPPSPPAMETEGSVSLQAPLLAGGRCQPGKGTPSLGALPLPPAADFIQREEDAMPQGAALVCGFR